MSGIPVYSQSPINAATADGIGPRTAAAAAVKKTESGPRANTATTTAIPSSTTSYPAAQPGASVMPAPTGGAQRYAPIHPTPTTKVDDDGPAPPQPSAVPAPPDSTRSNLPPPPKTGEKYIPSLPSLPSNTSQQFPPQMNIPSPVNVDAAQPPSSSTRTTTTSSTIHPVALPSSNYDVPRRSLEHPPGYVQNPYASNSSASQKRSEEFHHSADLGSYEHNKPNATAAFGVDPEGVWNTAKVWASTAGKKLSEVESEVWKRVNGQK